MTESWVAAADLPPVDRNDAANLGRAEGGATLALLRLLGDEDWARPTDCPEWNVRAMVSHLVAQCEDGLGLSTMVRRALAGRRRYRGLTGVDAHMAVQIDDHREDQGPDLVDRFAELWPRAVEARRRRPAPLRRMRIDLGIPGLARVPLAYLLDTIYNRDLWMHRVDLARATGRPFVIGDHDRHIVAQAVGELARTWPAAPVALRLTGPAGGSWVLGRGDPLAVVSANAVGYLRALAGRDESVDLTLVSGDDTALANLRRATIPF